MNVLECQVTLLATSLLIILLHGCVIPFGATDRQYRFITRAQWLSFIGGLPLIAAYMMMLYNTHTFTLFPDRVITWSLVAGNLVEVVVLVWLRMAMPKRWY